MLRAFWSALGLLALALGAIGAFLPVLPTTPFVILAAFCFAKGSPWLAEILENHAVFGPIIQDWRTHGAIARRYKAMAIAMMALAFGTSLYFGFGALVLAIQAVCLGAAALFILSRPS